MYLPTIRELAELSQASGAKGDFGKCFRVDPADLPFDISQGFWHINPVTGSGMSFISTMMATSSSKRRFRRQLVLVVVLCLLRFRLHATLFVTMEGPYWVRHYSDNAMFGALPTK